MEKISEQKYFIGAIIFFLVFVYIGGLMTRGMNTYSYVDYNTNINIK